MTTERAITLFVATCVGSMVGPLLVYALMYWRPWR